MKTRADLKRELIATVAPGEEISYLNSATSALEEARVALQSLRDERVRLKRLISIRERKHQDWKGKIPRGDSAPTRDDAQAEVARAGTAPCHRVADVTVGGNDGTFELVFRDEFKRGLSGVMGFEKIWVIAVAKGESLFRGGRCMVGNREERDQGLFLWLANVVAVDEKTGIVKIEGVELTEDECKVEDIAILDIKPYLPYCEAWPSSNGT